MVNCFDESSYNVFKSNIETCLWNHKVNPKLSPKKSPKIGLKLSKKS